MKMVPNKKNPLIELYRSFFINASNVINTKKQKAKPFALHIDNQYKDYHIDTTYKNYHIDTNYGNGSHKDENVYDHRDEYFDEHRDED